MKIRNVVGIALATLVPALALAVSSTVSVPQAKRIEQSVSDKALGAHIAHTVEAIDRVSVTVTSAQILTAQTTPVSILAAPGAGYANVILGVEAYVAGGTAYASVGAGDDLIIKYTDASGAVAAPAIETTGFLDQTTAGFRFARPGTAYSATPSDIVPVANAAIVIYLGGQITTGNFDLKLRVWYMTIPSTL